MSQSLTTLCVNFVLVTRANFSKIYIEIFASVGKRIKNTFVICFNIKMQEKRVIFSDLKECLEVQYLACAVIVSPMH